MTKRHVLLLLLAAILGCKERPHPLLELPLDLQMAHFYSSWCWSVVDSVQTTATDQQRCREKAFEAFDLLLANYDREPTSNSDVCYSGLVLLQIPYQSDPRLASRRARAESICCGPPEPYPDCEERRKRRGGWLPRGSK